MSVLVLENCSLSFGARAIFEDLSLRIAEGDRLGLIGPNGSGKSTLLRVFAGDQQPDSGVVRGAKEVRIGWLPQDIALEGGRSLLSFVKSSVPGRQDLEARLVDTEARYATIAEKHAKTGSQSDEEELIEIATELSEVHERLGNFDTLYSEHEATKILGGLGFKTSDLIRDLGEFSGGWKMRAVLAALLFQQPDVLLLDEPTNHLDMPSVAWFSDFLKRYQRAFILISHDREFLNEQISKVVTFEMEGVRQYTGNYERYLTQRAEEEEILEGKAKNLERERAHAKEFIDRFRAQATKAKAVQSRMKALDKMENVELYRKRRTMRFTFPKVERAGADAIRVEGVTKAYGTRVILPNVNVTVYRGDRIGIIGPNGAGKTTLLKMMAAEIEPTEGTIKIGHNVTPGYYAQHHADLLHPKNTVLQEVASTNDELGHQRVRSVLGAFLFTGDDVDKPISVLSGGERARVALARLLVAPGNLLLLDEPTNHLDLDSCESLIESMAAFEGTMVFVSHNRALIRRMATKIWVVDGGKVTEFLGSLDDYMLEERARLTGEDVKKKAAKAASVPPPAPKQGNAAQSKPLQAKPVDAKPPSAEEEKARKREEAKRRDERAKKIGPLKKKVEELEARIAEFDAKQKERNDKLCDPAAQLTDKERFAILDALQNEQTKLDELTERWEASLTELETAEKALA